MTTFANIQLPSNLVLDPFLAGLVSKLALDMPQFTFTTRGMSKQDISYATSPSSFQDRGVKPPEGTEFLRTVRVYKGSEFLGEVGVDRRYGSRQSEDVYRLKSWRIENERGNMNESRTSKLGGAVRIVKRAFVPMDVAEIVGKATGEMHHAFVGSTRDLMRPIQGGHMVAHTAVMQRYVYLLLRKEEVPEVMDKRMRDDMLTEKYEKAMMEYLLAEKMANKPMSVVVQHHNVFLYRRHSPNADVIEQKAYEELPEKVQNAVAVLQLMQDSELVDDIGYRYNDRNFLLLDELFN
jgi:hypothetical protein